MIMMMTMIKRLMVIMMILMFRAITSQKESCLSEFLPLAEMLTNLKIDRNFKEMMALAMMMALASKKVNKGRL